MLRRSLRLITSRRDHYQAALVFGLFIASLSMFFLAALATYIIIRTQAFQPIQREYVRLTLPVALWISTALLFAVSFFLERACWHVRREMRSGFLFSLRVAFWMAVLFTEVQSLGMAQLLAQHYEAIDGSTKAYGMSFTIAFIHVLHVLGGLIFLGYIWIQATRDKLDHERDWAVRHCAGYWHFLDLVWLAMLATFLITR